MAHNFTGVFKTTGYSTGVGGGTASTDSYVLTPMSLYGDKASVINRATGEAEKYMTWGGSGPPIGNLNGEYTFSPGSGGFSFNFVTEAMMPQWSWVSDDGLIARLSTVDGYLLQLTVAHSEAPTTPITTAGGLQFYASNFSNSVLAGHRDELLLKRSSNSVVWVTWGASTFTMGNMFSFPIGWVVERAVRIAPSTYRVFALYGSSVAVVDITPTTATHATTGAGLIIPNQSFSTSVDFADAIAATKDTITPGASTSNLTLGGPGYVVCDSLSSYLQEYLFVSAADVPYGTLPASEVDPLVLDKATSAYSGLATPTIAMTAAASVGTNWATSPMTLTLTTGVTFYSGGAPDMTKIGPFPPFWKNFYKQYER